MTAVTKFDCLHACMNVFQFENHLKSEQSLNCVGSFTCNTLLLIENMFHPLYRVQLNGHRFFLSANAVSFLLCAMLVLHKCNSQSTVTYNRGIGKVFTWGWNSNGQLYLGDGVTNATVDSHVPGIVTNLPKSSTTGAPILISGLAASTDFSLVLSGDGLLFSVGDNMKGQLGLGDHTNRKVLTLSVLFLNGLPSLHNHSSG